LPRKRKLALGRLRATRGIRRSHATTGGWAAFTLRASMRSLRIFMEPIR
jgi:hypothetical protein